MFQSHYINLFSLLCSVCVCMCVCVYATRRRCCLLSDRLPAVRCIYHIVCMYPSVRVCALVMTVIWSALCVCVSQQPTPLHMARSAKPSPTLHPSFHSSNEKVTHTHTHTHTAHHSLRNIHTCCKHFLIFTSLFVFNPLANVVLE